MITGYYSLIQYCPDLSRLEAANIGVVLLCPDVRYLGVKLSSGFGRVRKFFGSGVGDAKQFAVIRSSIENRLKAAKDQLTTVQDLKQFAAIQGNSVLLTPPRQVLVAKPEEQLTHLFDRLVGAGSRRKATDVLDILEREFAAPIYEPLIRRKVQVVVPVFHRAVTMPYGFQNGRFNLIRPARFTGESPNELLQTAGGLAVEGELLFAHADGDLGYMQLIVVGHFPKDNHSIAGAVRKVLKDHHTRLYRLEDSAQLFEEIRTSAKPFAKPPATIDLFSDSSAKQD